MNNDEERIEILETKIHTLMEEIKELKENQKNNMAFEPQRKRVGEDEDYYYVNDGYEIDESEDWNEEEDKSRFTYHNYFVNEEDAKKYLRVLNTEMKLRQLAEELNNGEEIDWTDERQNKYCLIYDCDDHIIRSGQNMNLRAPRTIYCLDEDFRIRAINEIGGKVLKEYLTYEF